MQKYKFNKLQDLSITSYKLECTAFIYVWSSELICVYIRLEQLKG